MTFEEILESLRQAQGDPLRLALATVDMAIASHPPSVRTALEAAAIPHWFDPKILVELLSVSLDEASALFDTLKTLPVVESFPAKGGCNVHETTRLALRQHLYQAEPDRFVSLSAKAANCWSGDDPGSQVEKVYHRLSSNPEEGGGELERLYWKWQRSAKLESIQRLGPLLEELSRFPLAETARGRILLILGWIRLNRMPLAELITLAREAVALLALTGPQSSCADAHALLGRVLEISGRRPDALAEFQAGKRIMESLTALDPANSDWQRDLSASLHHIGHIYQSQGCLPDALAEFQAGKRIMESLTALDPANSDWQRELSISHHNIGRIYRSQGSLPEALAEFQSDKRIMESLTTMDPVNFDWLRDLSVSHHDIGDIYQSQGRLPEALSEFQAGRRIMESLTAMDPANSNWQRDLSASHHHIGTIYQSQGRLPDALAEFQAGKGIMESLTALDLTNSAWLRDLSVSHSNIGSIYQSQDRLKEALTEFECDLAIAEALSQLDPTNQTWQEDLSITKSEVARLRKKLRAQ